MRDNFAKSIYMQMLEGGVTALANAYYPLSGSFIDVSQFAEFTFLIGLDTVVTPDFAVLQDTSATATASIKAITGAAKTDVVNADDGKWFTITVESAQLDIANSFRYVTLQASNTGGPDNANIWFFGTLARDKPVTQDSTNFLEEVLVAG